jgi:hypothetical protein
MAGNKGVLGLVSAILCLSRIGILACPESNCKPNTGSYSMHDCPVFILLQALSVEKHR